MIIIGLGNKDKNFENTRHNVGYKFIDYLITQNSTQYLPNANILEYNKYSLSFVAKVSINNNDVLLFKPVCYMNESGDVVKMIMKFYKKSVDEICIVHDDLDIELGKYVIQVGKGPHTHNGLNDIEQKIGMNFMRLRIGIENREIPRIPGGEYVLQNFSIEENNRLTSVFQTVYENISKIIK